MGESRLELNYANLKRLSDVDLVKLMLSPHVSPSLMRMLEYVFRRRLLNPVAADAIVDGCTVEVPCVFRECEETPSFSFIAELLEERL